MTNNRFRVRPGHTVDLRHYDPADTRPFKNKRKSIDKLEKGLERLLERYERWADLIALWEGRLESASRKDREKSWLAKLMFWKPDEKDKPEQYRIKVAEVAPNSVVSVQDTTGAPEKSQNSEKILALLKEQLK